MTSDNDKEFSQHKTIAKTLNTDFYFARPYAARERGSNENMNGLIRQYIPKHRDLRSVTEVEIQNAMERMNNRPRKCLGYQHRTNYSSASHPFYLLVESASVIDDLAPFYVIDIVTSNN